MALFFFSLILYFSLFFFFAFSASPSCGSCVSIKAIKLFYDPPDRRDAAVLGVGNLNSGALRAGMDDQAVADV